MVIEVPFRAVTSLPSSENPRRSRGFTIESLIGSDLERNNKRENVCSQPAHRHHHHHSPLPPPPPPPATMGHVSNDGTIPVPHLPLGGSSLSLSSSSSSSSSSSASPPSSTRSSVSPSANRHQQSGGSVTSTSLSSTSPLTPKNPLKCPIEYTGSISTHQHGNSTNIHSSNNYCGKNSNGNSNNVNNNNRRIDNNCTSSSNNSNTTTISNTNNNLTSNKPNSYNTQSRSPSPMPSHISETEKINGANCNINITTTSINDNNNNINGTIKSDESPGNHRQLPMSHLSQYAQQQTPLGLVTHSIEKTLLPEDKERYAQHPSHPSQNQAHSYHHHHHSPPVPVSSPTGTGAGLHYPLKCVQNTEDYYRGAASGFTPVRLCNHPLGSAVNVAAAAAAAAAAAGSTPTWTGVLPPTSQAAAAAAAAAAMSPVNMSIYRDHTTLFNPWMFARCAGYLGHRYPVGHDGAFLLPPYRKPKRIRTAFSPSQLLQLEEAFEKNHYVVGQERKELAADLKLTETQVKVWFQNRRTKHKRMKAEEEATSGSASTTREEPTSSSRTRTKEMDIDPTGMEPIEYDGSDDNSDSELIRTDT